MAKYRADRAKKLKFARFGGLSSVNQRGYDSSMPTFHSPPANRGFYCFVWPFYEMFLLGAECTLDPQVTGAKFTYVRDGKGQILSDIHPDYATKQEEFDARGYSSVQSKEWANWRNKNWPDCDDPDYAAKLEAMEEAWQQKHPNTPKWIYVQKPKPRIFEYDGVLWHHLGPHLRPGEALAQKGSWTKSTVQDYRRALENEIHDAQKSAQEFSIKYKAKYMPHLPSGTQAIRTQSRDHLECFIEKL